ncbi:MAG: hypothetical protein O9972_64595 [Burkholderiales bacterium]|nr:hypothetical protein [Burkholderiales bacterium]
MSTRRARPPALAAALAVGLGAAGCSSDTLFAPDLRSTVATATVPFALVGGTDGRARFREAFCAAAGRERASALSVEECDALLVRLRDAARLRERRPLDDRVEPLGQREPDRARGRGRDAVPAAGDGRGARGDDPRRSGRGHAGRRTARRTLSRARLPDAGTRPVRVSGHPRAIAQGRSSSRPSRTVPRSARPPASSTTSAPRTVPATGNARPSRRSVPESFW